MKKGDCAGFRGHSIETLIVDTILATGCNPSELIQLTPKNLADDALNIPAALTKNRTARRIALKRRLARQLKANLPLRGRQGAFTTRRIQQILKSQGTTARELRKKYLRKHREDSGLKHMKQTVCVRIPRIKGRDGLIISILKRTGCKTSELCDLRVSDIGRRIHVGDRTIELTGSLLRKLQKHCKKKSPDEFILQGSNGALTPRRIQQILQAHNLSPRIIRRAYAQKLARKGSSNDEISKALGVKKVTAFTHGII